MKSRIDRGMPLNLNDQMNAMGKGLLPTPQFDDAKNSGHNQRRSPTLASTVFLPTPEAGFEGKAGSTVEYFEKRQAKGKQIGISGNVMMAAEASGENRGLRLQPAFVEWMMGFPQNWTSLEHETTA